MPHDYYNKYPERNDSDRYFLLPNGKRHYVGYPQNEVYPYRTDHPINDATKEAFTPNRNERTGHIVMPLLGSSYDDWFLSAIAKGTMHGVGLTPIIDGEAANVIRRLQMLVHDWVISYKSRFRTPMLNASRLFSMAEDGEGVQKLLSNMTGGVLSQNSGHIYATLPLHMHLDTWRDWGAELIPILDQETGDQTEEYRLQVSTRAFIQNRGVWTLDNLQCDPTGDPEWPVRVRKESEEMGSIWVLCNKAYVRQTLGELGSVRYDLAGWWPCPLYTYFGEMGVMNAMVTEYNYEGFFNAPPEGVVALTGADHENQLAEMVATHLDERRENNSLYYPGTMWLSIKNKDGKIFFVPFKKPSEGFSQEEFVRLKQRRLALAFGLSLNFVTLEIGVGAVHQAAVADMLGEITGISWIKNKAQHIFNWHLSPRSVQVSVNIPSSAATKQQAEVLSTVSGAIKSLQDAGASLSSSQIHQIIEKFTGNTIPYDNGNIVADSEDVQVGSTGETVEESAKPEESNE